MNARANYSSDGLEAILAWTNLVALVGCRVKLDRKGRAFWGLCPFHKETNPSFKVENERRCYHCFGCGAHGDAIDWLRKMEGLSFCETVRRLAAESGAERQEDSSKRENGCADPSRGGKDDNDTSEEHSAFALRLWNEAHAPCGTLVERYLAGRALALDDDVAEVVLRYHPALRLLEEGSPYHGEKCSAMVALFRDIATGEPCGVQRLYFDKDGRPLLGPRGKKIRKMLGRVSRAAIMLDANETVTYGLHIGEGIETCVAARAAGFRPAWALGSAGAIAGFPVLAGIDALTILGERDENRTNERAVDACARRWLAAGREVAIVDPLIGKDMNDAWKAA